jgi:NAD(P)-dependent dehydrogenase (short-subunit alcohol dehydrogenase family)
MQLTGTAAVVTGAASGLGQATAAELARLGARVVGLDLPAAVDAASSDAPVGVRLVACDVTDPEQVGAALDIATVEGLPLRVAVSCAGVAPSRRLLGSRGPHDVELFARTVTINLVGTFTVMTLAAERIARADTLEDGARGVIVNTASVAAWDGQIGQAAYAASKGGVAALTLPAARDLASYGIRVLTIAPGVMETPMLAGFDESVRESLAASVPFPARLGRPEEFARLVAFAVEHDYLNGETVRMDGALRMAPR